MKLRPDVKGLDLVPHGGGCCGITHLYNFPLFSSLGAATDDERIGWIRSAINQIIDDQDYVDADGEQTEAKNFRHAVEVVLAWDQLNEWRSALETVGFQEVFSFTNDNSGNRCHVFFIQTGRDL